jgi:iron complex outermembrane receptor protein
MIRHHPALYFFPMNLRFILTALLFLAPLAARAAKGSADDAPPVNLDPVVITSAKTQQPLVVSADPKAPAQPVPAHDGADVLKSVPGFSVIRKGGTDGDPVLRGLAGSRLGIQIDGESIFGGCGSRMDPPTAYVFPAAYDRITVIKGPQTVLRGPGLSAGVVLFERDVHRLDARTASLRATATAASFGRIDGLVDAQAGNARGQARVTATYTRADDYEDGTGSEVHSAYERWSTHATLVWTPAAHTSVELTGARSDGEAAYADRAMDGVKFDRTNYGLRFRRTQVSPTITAVEARVYHNYVDHVMDNYTLRPFVASMMMANPSVSNPDRLTEGALAQLTLAPTDALTITAGVDTQRNEHTVRSSMNQTMMPYGAMARGRDAEFTQSGFFGEGTYTVATGRRLIAGARLDQWKAEDPRTTVALSMMATAANPSAGRTRRSDLASGFARYEHDLGRTAAPLTLFAGLGRVQRFPDYWELIKNESATSVTAFSTAPETTTQLDVGALARRGNVEWSVSLFVADIADYVLVQSGVTKPSGMMGTRSAVITRSVDASTLGGEAAVSWRFAAHWKADASLAYVRGQNDTDGRALAQMPPLEARLALAYATEWWSVGGLVRAVAAQDRFAVNQGNIVGQDLGASPGFGVWSLHASRRLGNNYRASVGLDNLLDKTYAEHISRAGGSVPGFIQTTRVNEPGRTLWLKIDASF